MENIWKDEYNVGVSYVDEAHKKLFSVLRKTSELLGSGDYEKNRHACIEAIKFLYNYTATHFEQEEAYMRKSNYPGYESHKLLHDNLRNTTLPQLESELQKKNFDEESISRFFAIFSGWLASHILIEDRAITGKARSRWNNANLSHEELENTLHNELNQFFNELFSLEMHLINRRYEGRTIKEGFYYEMTFNNTYQITVIGENPLILHMIHTLLGTDNAIFDKQAVASYTQLLQTLGKTMLQIIYSIDNLKLTNHRSIKHEDLLAAFALAYPDVSLEWNTDYGRFAACIKSK